MLRVKLFVTCWLIFVLHFATDIVREHYLAFSIAESYSFRVDEYLGLHVDIFETPGHGAHIGNNPGASMLGAVPYWLTRPIIDRVVDAINARRAASGRPVTAVYDDSRPRRVEFYRQVRERGLDVQFGLAAAVMQAGLMAPASAAAAVLLFEVLLRLGFVSSRALLYAFVYALGTPIFFRTAFLNQNLLIAHLLLLGFVAVWRPGGFPRWSDRTAWTVAGAVGGISVLCDYSGLVVLGWLGAYTVWTGAARGRRLAGEAALRFLLGAIGPIALLLFYQWQSFGSPWYPGQHYMPPVEWVEIGYRGVGWPEPDLLRMLLVDPRFGLFVTCPLLALAGVGLIRAWWHPIWLPRAEASFLLAAALGLLVFFGAVQYTRLQWVTGIRYLVPAIPALFLLTIPALEGLPALLRHTAIVLALAESWCLSMVRAIDVIDSVQRVMLGGFQLPWMSVLSKMAPQYFPFMADHASPLPLFALAGALLYGLWAIPEASSRG